MRLRALSAVTTLSLTLATVPRAAHAAPDVVKWRAMSAVGGRSGSGANGALGSGGWDPAQESQSANYKVRSGFVNAAVTDEVPPGTPAIASPTHPDPTQEYADDDPQFALSGSTDASGIAGYFYILDQASATLPGASSGTFIAGAAISLADVPDGTWYLHATAKDGAGNAAAVAAHFKLKVKTTATPALGGIFSAGDGSSVEIPSGAVDSAATVSIRKPASAPPLIRDPGLRDTGLVREIKLSGGAALQRSITVTLAYRDTEVAGLKEQDFRIVHYDDRASLWRMLSKSTPYPDQNKVVGQVDL